MTRPVFNSVGCLTFALLLLTGCQQRDGYFGRVQKPSSKRLVFENMLEPSSIDPQLATTTYEALIIDALFDSLVRLHPVTLQPTAALATHYERNAEATRYVFYLRGHPQPRGIRLPNTDDMREEFRTGKIPMDLSRGHSAPPDTIPARWSDGRVITAHDFVYSWHRLFDPKTAAPFGQMGAFVLNSAEILAGKQPTKDLGVRALDDSTLEVLLDRPSDFFVLMQDWGMFYPVPRHAIEAAEARGAPASWTEPGRIVTSGAFQLADWKPYEQLTVRKNPYYWEAGLTGLDELVFLPIGDNLTNLNLYRAGKADTLIVPPAYVPLLKNLRDHISVPALEVYYVELNTRQPPLDNVLVRYAINMATDKRQVAKLLNGAQTPARTYCLPYFGYQAPVTIPVTIQGRVYDVSSYDPEAAREILAMAGYSDGKKSNGNSLRIEYIYASSTPVGSDLAEVLRRQWQENLGIELTATKVDALQFSGMILGGQYKGMAQWAWVPAPEPATFFDLLFASEQNGGMFWMPPAFAKKMSEAKATVDPATRLRRVAEADRMIMEGMPLVPLFHNAWDYMIKPYVKGLPMNVGFDLRFKYAWVETE